MADDLDVIDAALDRLRATSTGMVGNAFRLDMAARLERHRRMAMAVSYRTFGEIMQPPDGVEDPALPAGVKVCDLVCRRQRIMHGREAWAVNGDPPEVDRVHHDDELFDDEDVGLRRH